MGFSFCPACELVKNSKAEVRKNPKLFVDKTILIIPTINKRQKNNDYTLFKPQRHLMQKAGISFQKKKRAIQRVETTIYTSSGKSLFILNMAVDFGRFHFPVLT